MKKELLTLTAVAVAVMVLGSGLYLGLGYAQTAWSRPAQPSLYAHSLQQVTDHGYTQQASPQSRGGWYCPGASYYGMGAYNGSMGRAMNNRGWHMGSGYSSGTGNSTVQNHDR